MPPASGVVDTLPDKGRDRLARCGSCDRLRESKEPEMMKWRRDSRVIFK